MGGSTKYPVPRPHREREDWEAATGVRGRATAGSVCTLLGWLFGALSSIGCQNVPDVQDAKAPMEGVSAVPTAIGSEEDRGSDGGLLPQFDEPGLEGFAGPVAPILPPGPEPKLPSPSLPRVLPQPKPRNPALRR